MKKLLTITAVLALTVTVLFSGCGNATKSTNDNAGSTAGSAANSTDSGNKTINYWYPWGGASETWDKERMAEFEKENPGWKINATYVPPDGGIANGKLVTAIASGNPPDIFISPQYQQAYALGVQGALEPLDEPLKKAGFDINQVNPVFNDVAHYNGKIYTLPHDSTVQLLYMNNDLFAAAGLDVNNPPKTLKELDQMAAKLTKVENGKIKCFGFVPWLDSGDDPFFWNYMFGGNLYDTGTQKINITDGKEADVLNWMKSYTTNFSPETVKSFTSGFGGAFSPDHPFMTGQVAMTVSGNWFMNALKTYAPNVKFTIAPCPAPEGGRYGGTALVTNVFGVPRGAKNIDGAAKFIMFCESAEQMNANVTPWRAVILFKDQYKDLELVKNGDELYKTVLKVAQNSNSGHTGLTSVASQMHNDLNTIRDDVIYNHVDPVKLLADEQDKLQTAADALK